MIRVLKFTPTKLNATLLVSVTPFPNLVLSSARTPASPQQVIAFTSFPRCKPPPEYTFRQTNEQAFRSAGLEIEN